MVKVLFFPVGAPPEVREIPRDGQSLAQLVGGLFDTARVGKRCRIYVNDTGMIDGLPVNVVAPTYQMPLCGPAVLAAEGYVNGDIDLVDLTDEEIAWGKSFARSEAA